MLKPGLRLPRPVSASISSTPRPCSTAAVAPTLRAMNSVGPQTATALLAGSAGIGYELEALGKHWILAIPLFYRCQPLRAGANVIEGDAIAADGTPLSYGER